MLRFTFIALLLILSPAVQALEDTEAGRVTLVGPH